MVIELVTSLPMEECARRLREALATGAVRGRFDGTKLIVTKTISYRNSFQTRLVANLAEVNGQTHLRCKFGMHPLVIVFMMIWLWFLFSAGGGMVFAAMAALLMGSPTEDNWAGGLFPGIMMMFGLGVMAVGRIIARGEKGFLIAFVSDTVKGELRSSVT